MAVRHGYGKIAGADALVFAYDTGDTINSYRGKPATNIATTISSRGPGVTADPSDLPAVPKSVASAVYCSSKINGSTTSWESLFQYNTSFSVPDGQRLTVSAWVYIPESKINNRFNFNCSVNGANTGLTVGSHDVPTGKWVKIHGHYLNSTGATVSVTSTRLETYTAAEWTGTSISCWAINFMVEQSADIPLGYTGSPATALGGTRSATQGLLDLTGNRSIDLTNVSFDSNAQMEFDGTTDLITATGFKMSTTDSTQEYTLEAVIKRGGGTTTGGIITQYRTSVDAPDRFGFREMSPGYLSWWKGGNIAISSNSMPTGEYIHIVGTRAANGSVTVYQNSVVVATGTDDRVFEDEELQIGSFGAGIAHFDGEIPLTKIYNRALTAAEVQSNYRHYKTRFNI